MNWYIKICQNIIDRPRGGHYMDIGHRVYRSELSRLEDNYLWIFNGKDILVIPEMEGDQYATHEQKFKEIENRHDLYMGRYESPTGRLSIKKPISGILAFRTIPEWLVNILNEKFNNITEITVC